MIIFRVNLIDYNIKYSLNVIFFKKQIPFFKKQFSLGIKLRLCCKIIIGKILEVERIGGIMVRRMLQVIKLALLTG